jgi:CheY-like chemotaxis protein
METKILIVDDSSTVRFQERLLLKGLDVQIDEAVNSEEALQKVRLNRPDLVLLDIMMPGMDGVECCRRIKSDPELKNIWVYMVTTQDAYKKIDAAFKAGCNGYLKKPINKEELMEKIRDVKMFQKLKRSPASAKRS